MNFFQKIMYKLKQNKIKKESVVIDAPFHAKLFRQISDEKGKIKSFVQCNYRFVSEIEAFNWLRGEKALIKAIPSDRIKYRIELFNRNQIIEIAGNYRKAKPVKTSDACEAR